MLFAFCAFAKSDKVNVTKKVSIKGKIIDSRTKEGIPFTTVVLKSGSLDNSIGSITDDQGVFEIENVPKGKYIG